MNKVEQILDLMDNRKAEYQEYINFAYNLDIPWDISHVFQHITAKETHLREFWEMTKNMMLGGKQYYSLDYIREHKDEIKWEILCGDNTRLDHRIFFEFWDKLNWMGILYTDKLTEEEIEFYIEKVLCDLHYNESYIIPLCSRQILSEQLIEKHLNVFKNSFLYICQWQELSEDFMRRHKDIIDWDNISSYQELSEEFMDEFEQKINWENVHKAKELSKHYVMKIYNEFMNNKHYRWVAEYNKITESFITRYWDRFKWDWDALLPVVKVSEDFIDEYGEIIDRWDLIAETQTMSEEFLTKLIKKYKDFDLSNYVLHAAVSEDFLRNNFEIIDKKVFWNIIVSQHLSESFIREFADYLDLSSSTYVDKKDINYLREWKDRMRFTSPLFNQPLDEKAIDEFRDRLNWDWISQRCKLSEQFIEKYSERISWTRIDTYQDLSEEFRNKYFDRIFNHPEDIF